ncbi:MAG: hypothetical protein RIQ56_1023 [Candidatus Parcubacteria bacterium]|jgi:glycosyltransferase involved in cell wall biosynthesis
MPVCSVLEQVATFACPRYSVSMRIVIATPLYPPEVGGPSYYAEGLAQALQKKGESVSVISYGSLKYFPMGARHFFYACKLLPYVLRSEIVIILDTFSAALPAVFLATIFRKNALLRTGGDFLWEQYVERTKQSLPLPNFYSFATLSPKEQLIFRLTRWLLHKCTVLFSTEFQRELWVKAYSLNPETTKIVENAIEPSLDGIPYVKKNFLFYVRPIFLKNRDRLVEAFAAVQRMHPGISLEEGMVPKKELLEKMKSCYAVILPSLSEVSPNYITDALRFRKPFILTKHTGYADVLKNYGILIDPLDVKDIQKAIETLATADGYKSACEKAQSFSLKERTYEDVANDFMQYFPR